MGTCWRDTLFHPVAGPAAQVRLNRHALRCAALPLAVLCCSHD